MVVDDAQPSREFVRRADGSATFAGSAPSSGFLWEGASKTATGIGGGKYKLTPSYLIFERGVLSSQSQQVPLEGIQDIDLRQSPIQKARGVADLIVHAMNPTGLPEQVALESITDGYRVRDLINEARAARVQYLREQERIRMMPQVISAPVVQAAHAAPAAGDDLMSKLSKLGEMRAAGLLDDAEFAAAKAKLLGL